MKIYKSIDIEDEIRNALDLYLDAYVRPLPAEYALPHIEITKVGGTDSQTIDTFSVVLDARAETEAEAVDYLNTAIGILRQVAKEQTSRIRHVTVNSSGSWGKDPVRQDLSMNSARLEVVAHQSETEVDEQYEPIIADEDVFVVAKRM